MERIDYSKMPESDVVVDEVERRFKKGLGTNIIVIGLSGTGKSSTSARLGELISERLNHDTNFDENSITSSLLELLEFIRRVKRPGEVCIIEEVSVLFPSKRAISQENTALGMVMDTIRKKQIIIISNAPILKTIDGHMRSMCHISVETMRINKTQGVVVSKPMKLQTNPDSGKTYKHRFHRNGIEIQRIYTKMPSKDLWDAYELKKDKFMDMLYDRLKLQMLKKDEKLLKEMGIISKVTVNKPLSPRELEAHTLVNINGLTQTKAAEQMGVSSQRVNIILKNVVKKTNISRKIEKSPFENIPNPATT